MRASQHTKAADPAAGSAAFMSRMVLARVSRLRCGLLRAVGNRQITASRVDEDGVEGTLSEQPAHANRLTLPRGFGTYALLDAS